MPLLNPLTLLLLPLLIPLVSASVPADYTNLPSVPPGVFNAQTRIQIATTIPAIWSALTNFPLYPTWNPFVRSAVVAIPLNSTVPPQYPVEGYHLHLRTQIPALPLPVNETTPDNPLHTQFASENITHVQEDLGRLAWAYMAGVANLALQAERWQAVSDLGNGTVLYESREEFYGPAAVALKALMGKALQEAFDAQGLGLKLLLEGGQ